MMSPKPPPPPTGVWCPAVTFFDPSTDKLHLEAQEKYYTYLSKTGLVGLVILGTNAEAFLLTREERKILISLARQTVGHSFPIMAGCGAHSTAQVLELLRDAKEAGADSALVFPPAYFGKASTPAVVKRVFEDVARENELPVVIYNFPGVCNEVDLDSETITALAKGNANIVGVKLTCGSVAKIARLSAELSPESFSIFGGQSDFMIGALASGSAGCIAAFANVFPKSLARIYDLYRAGKTEEALKIHRAAALAESPCKSGIAATKYAAAIYTAKAAGIEGAEEKLLPQRPYEGPTEPAKENVRKTMAALAAIEKAL